MRLLAHVHAYPPAHNAGAEWMLHSILAWLVEQGHECHVYGASTRKSLVIDGVELHGRCAPRKLVQLYELIMPDVVITHLDETQRAVNHGQFIARPIVHLVHNDIQLAFHKVKEAQAQLVVHNSEWIAKADRLGYPSMVVRPPVFADRYRTETTREYVTLINLTKEKGAPIFYDLARENPDQLFLGVRGGYGVQEVPLTLPENVTIIDNTPDIIGEVYARTKILLVPSTYESWGRVAIEAAASGIPIIANPTPGLKESLGSAGLFAARKDPRAWNRELRRLLENGDHYAEFSRRTSARAIELDPTPELKLLEQRLIELSRSR